jgi:hypothetical protein
MPETTTLAFVPVIVEAAGEVVYGIIEAVAAAGTGEVIVSQPQSVPENIGKRADVQEASEEDGRKVVKVHDAIKCCEDFMNSQVVSSLIFAMIRGQLRGDTQPIDQYFSKAMHLLAECIRKKALQQNNTKHRRRRKGVTRERRGINAP